MPISTGNVNKLQSLNSNELLHFSLPTTESELVSKAGSLAVDLMFNEKKSGPLPQLGKLDHSACCYDHLKFLKAKLSTLNTLHKIGLCHGSVNSEHFFVPRENETACQWQHADTTAFYQDDEFHYRHINDILQAAAVHLPDAHTEGLLEQTPVQHQIEALVGFLNTPLVYSSPCLSMQIDNILTNTLKQLESEQPQLDKDQKHRSNLWIKNLQQTETENSSIYSHTTDPFYPHIKEWRIANKDQGKINELTSELNTDFENQKVNACMPRVIAWVQFEESEQQVIRAAYGAAT